MTTTGSSSGGPRVRRRGLLGVGLGVGGLALGAGGTVAVDRALSPHEPDRLIPFHGAHQGGVETPLQAHGVFTAHDLRDGVDLAAATRLMRLVSDDAARLCRAEPAVNDQEPELARTPSRLTVTVGFGPGWFERLGLQDRVPTGFADLPSYEIDQLQRRWSGGDLLLQVCGDDALVVSHAVRQLSKTVRAFTTPRWVQRGFSTPMSTPDSPTPRNLMGQIDGTVNPRSGTDDFATVVWADRDAGVDWFAGGTMLVLRRIAMLMETWDELDPHGQELAVGRRIATGAPLTGQQEHDQPDLNATDHSGLPVIPKFSHIARAAHTDRGDRFLRRSYNYDEGVAEDGTADLGLLFAAYQANLTRQYLPVQGRLAQQDLLNEWTVPIGSAVFALPPGCGPDGFLGEGLLR